MGDVDWSGEGLLQRHHSGIGRVANQSVGGSFAFMANRAPQQLGYGVQKAVEHALRLFIGPRQALAAYQATGAGLTLYALTPSSALHVLPLSDDAHDSLHRVYGTGEWLDSGPRLTSRDIAFAAAASAGSCLGYIETDYLAGVGRQSALAWHNGAISFGPATLDHAADRALGRDRPRQLWPINACLRSLGVQSVPGYDEFTSFGLANYRDVDDVCRCAIPIR